WQTAFVEAMEAWNSQTLFNFVLRNEYRHPCANDLVNGVDFTADVCGNQFGDNTLAVTLRAWETEILGPPKLVNSDIVFNNNQPFDVYNGSPFQAGLNFNGVDFRRVALHELGHALGLDHSIASSAIMRATINNNDRLRPDDIDGANTLYGGLFACAIQPLLFGIATDALQAGDCTVQQLTVGGNDDSFIDVRRLVLSSTATITVDMKSDTLDSVLLLADAGLRFLTLDDNSGGGCNARLTRQLAAGTYYILSNTYDDAADACANTLGPYVLEVSFESAGTQGLGAALSLQGGMSNAQFSGGITASNGLSYGNHFGPNDSLDINATIAIDPLHQGLAGFLVVAVLIDDDLLLMDETGTLVSYAGDTAPIVRAASRILGAVEALEIARDLVPAELGIQSIEADFLVGYGLDSNPGEVYYHQNPLNLVISP
ncbi:MAG: matrixin family metalloprotease, partial [Pseudohongiellaceae bacterium]